MRHDQPQRRPDLDDDLQRGKIGRGAEAVITLPAPGAFDRP